jgi:hypothetical protein
VECEAGAYQVATASPTRDVVVRRWALDEQLTEDADGAGRQLKLARDHWLAVAHCCRAFPEEVIGRHHADSSTPRKPENYGVSAWDGEPQLIFRRC